MKLTAQLKLRSTPEQAEALLRTLEAFNAACNYISASAWESKTFHKFAIQQLCYREARERFGLTAQAAIRAIKKVADAYKLDTDTQRTFRATGAAAYDDRILRFNADSVSIWAIGGRLTVPFVCGDYQRSLLNGRRGESDLVYRNNEWYLFVTVVARKAPLAIPADFIGVDMGIANIATTSDGNRYSGAHIKSVRLRHRRLRRRLQAKQTRAAKRRLKKLSGKEAAFARHTNHVISKQIVALAEGTGRGIAIEDLEGIRDRVTVRRGQRVILHSWAFYQFKQFLEYKALLAGVVLLKVNAAYSSLECSNCGHTGKQNRPSQSRFLCRQCGFARHADKNAAMNLRARGQSRCKPAEGDSARLSDRAFVSHG